MAPADGPDGVGPASLPPAWRDHADRATARPPPPSAGEPPFYLDIMAFQGADYDRNAFAMGTTAEVAALRERLGLRTGTRVLDVGCATGRHLRSLAVDPGCIGTGVDVSPQLVEVARRRAAEVARDVGGGVVPDFVVGDARALTDVPAVAAVHAEGGFDVAWSLCQGGFGTDVAGDPAVLAGMAAVVRPGGLLAVTAFHALFAVRTLVEGDAYDVVNGVHHQEAEVRGPDHAAGTFDLWTTTWTVRELVGAATAVGLEVIEVVGCEPGRLDADTVRLSDPELLLVTRRPG